MNWLRNKYNRTIMSICMGLLAAALSAGIPEQKNSGTILAWWGTLYPAFCFEEGEEQKTTAEDGTAAGAETQLSGQKTSKSRSEPDVKISFWLAKVFDRW